nr:putative disease resistance protein At1g58400 [Ziziphus jujuba var. spinosa]
MAEFVFTKLAESVWSQTVERIPELLIHEAASLKVRDDVVLLQDELESLKGFIKKDVIETYIHIVASSCIQAFHNKRVRAEINFVRERIKVISTSMQAYGITSVAAGEAVTSSSIVELQRILRKKTSPSEEDNDVIVLEDSSMDLTAELTKEEDQLCIVFVVGVGGLGKTTLAKKVFNNIKHHFQCSAWVFLSQRFVPENVFIEISKQVDSSKTRDDLQQKKEQELIELLQNELKEKRYLVVLDDIWMIAACDFIKRIDKLKDIETLKKKPASLCNSSYDALHKLTNLRKISIKFHVNQIQDEVGCWGP